MSFAGPQRGRRLPFEQTEMIASCMLHLGAFMRPATLDMGAWRWSPAHFASASTPSRPEYLTAHESLHHRYPTTGKLQPWPLAARAGGADIALPVTATSNTTETLISLAEFGVGLRAGLFRPRSNCDRISRTDAGKLHRASRRVPRGLDIEQLPITQAESISRLHGTWSVSPRSSSKKPATRLSVCPRRSQSSRKPQLPSSMSQVGTYLLHGRRQLRRPFTSYARNFRSFVFESRNLSRGEVFAGL
jgi:hypothetical protein